MVPRPEFIDRSNQAQRMYQTDDVGEAWTLARRLGVDYIYIDRVERAAYSANALNKFDGQPSLFRLRFANAEVSIFSVENGAAIR
jgi:uncharacterized membrane protein